MKHTQTQGQETGLAYDKLKGAQDMLREAEKMFRSLGGIHGHAVMCGAHAKALDEELRERSALVASHAALVAALELIESGAGDASCESPRIARMNFEAIRDEARKALSDARNLSAAPTERRAEG